MVATTHDPTTPEPAAAGLDEARLEQLVEAEPVVRRICRSRLGYWDGDDIAQEALLSTWRAAQRPDFEDRGTLVPYAASAARSLVKTGYQRRDRQPVPAGDQTEWGDAWFDQAPGPDQVAEHAEAAAQARARVGELLERLTPRQREAVTECALGERDTDQVAAQWGVNASSVRSSQVRAMARMRELCGTRSINPLASGLSEYERNRRAWERERACREQEQGRVIPRKASRHLAARLAAADPTVEHPTGPTTATAPAAGDERAVAGDPLARAAGAVARARRSVADDLADDDVAGESNRPVDGHSNPGLDHDHSHGHERGVGGLVGDDNEAGAA